MNEFLRLEYALYAEDMYLDGDIPLEFEAWVVKKLIKAQEQITTLQAQVAGLKYLELLVKDALSKGD